MKIDNGLVLYLPFNDGSGSKVRDKSKYQNHGTISGAKWAKGKAMSFDGSGDYIVVADSATYKELMSASNKPATFAAWVHIIGNKRNAVFAKQNQWALDIDTLADKIYFAEWGADDAYVSFVSIINKWYHIVWVHTGSDRKVYVDGQLVGEGLGTNLRPADNYNMYIGRVTVEIPRDMNGYIDEPRIYNRALSPTEISNLYLGEDIRDGLVFYQHYDDGGATDYSGNGNNGTIYGATSVDISGKIGTALDFDGTDDYVENTSPNSLPSGANPFSMFAWVKSSDITGQQTIVGWGTNTPDQAIQLLLNYNGLLYLHTLGSNDWNTGKYISSANIWAYIGFTYDGVTVRAYINGVEVASVARTLTTVNNILRIGRNIQNNLWMNGLIDEVRIYNRALTVDEIRSLYNERAFSLDNGRVLYLPFNEGSGTKTRDLSLFQNHGTISGASWVTGKIGMGLSFDGTNDDLQIADSSSINQIDANSFSIVLWIKTSETNERDFFARQGTGWVLVRVRADGELRAQIYDGSNSAWSLTNTAINDGLWHHIVYVINRTTNLSKVYIDGVEKDSDSISAIGNLQTSGQILYIGKGLLSGGYFNGQIDEVFIFNRALSAEEVRTLYSQQVKN